MLVRLVSLGDTGDGRMSSYTELGVNGSSTRNHQWRRLAYLETNESLLDNSRPRTVSAIVGGGHKLKKW